MFSRANPFDESVIAATNENLTVENWELILAVTDKITRASPESARDCVAAVEKRLNNKNPNVQLYAVALIEALVKNCDITVHREISSRSFTNTLTKLVHDRSVHAKVRLRILEFIQMCSFEFRIDSTLGLMNEVYHSLRAEGIQFPSPQKPKKEFTQSELDKQKEEEEFQLALALSLSESENRPSYKSSTSTAATTAPAQPKPSTNEEATPQISRVRALYDFQPTETGELGFEKGDIIRVIESVYRDWWKGELRGKTGIFPVNYVEKIVDPSPSDLLKEASIENQVMNETRNIDRLLEMLNTGASSDNDELQQLYNSTLSIRPKLVKLIEKYSLKKDELVALNEKFMQARSMYDGMLSSSIAKYSQASYGNYQPQQYGYGTAAATATTTNVAYNNTYGYQQQQSPTPAASQQQPAYAYNTTEQYTAPPPTQQQAQYPSYETTPQQQTTATSDYSAQQQYPPANNITSPPAAQNEQQATYPQQQQQQQYSYPPVSYNSPPPSGQPQQQYAAAPSGGQQPAYTATHNY